ncbi:MAG: hypothetical protein Q7S09_05260 [bacterium]|nr:hypothetical protein [bacterium]
MPLWLPEVLQWALPVLAGGSLFYFLSRFLQRRRKKTDSSEDRDNEISDRSREDRERREQERLGQERREQEKKEAKAREALSANKILARHLLKKAGIDNRDPEEVADEPETVRRVARALSDQDLELARIAATQSDIDFQLETQAERQAVQYPTSDMEPAPLTAIEQFPDILPEQMLMDDEEFYLRLAENDLLILQSHETHVDQKLLYILLDISPSMNEPMTSGYPRHIWARGVIVNLLLKAMAGKAKYFMRYFDSGPEKLQQILTSQEAEQLLDKLLSSHSVGSGTHIFSAFAQAVKDIRELGGDVSRSEILLITDGEDNSMDNTETVKDLMGKDIRLHAVLIGTDSKSLKQVAQTYRNIQ